ncbi:PhzF family phenazine biosynthesis protein [Achromobacter sp.]|uniref:PhzF family phenazine biosynthesis protein n=1 Tax=Achromobacter sp. TaxID=134375 RepID=UPI0028AE7ABD|nr:PhzF family phenazine biosynthesis protein [Achromobacter sp.]
MSVPFKQVDVFTSEPYRGNPVAVVLDGQGLSDEQMRRIANWTNLSETTFVLPATQTGADYRVRIFTPQAELPFAGHPTLGTAHALLEAGIIAARNGKLVQECEAGLIELAVTDTGVGTPLIAFTLPDASLTALSAEQVDVMESILGSAVLHDPAPKLVNVGPVWTIAQMPSAQAVLTLRPDFALMADFDRGNKAAGIVVYGAYGEGAEAAIEVRAFAPSLGANEDPVCGSGNGSVAAFIREAGQVAQFGTKYLSTQGAAVGRSGRLSISFDDSGVIRVGGQSVTCIDGSIAV